MSGEVSGIFVMIMGLTTVFVGLILLIMLCKLISWFCMTFLDGKNSSDNQTAAMAVKIAEHAEVIPNKQELIAVVSAVLAEELGKDVSRIRIHSIKKL